MSERQTTRERRLSNERALYRYTRAFERGDIEIIAAILQEASQNAELEDMIYEMHHLYQQEDQLENQLQEQNFPAAQENHNQEVNIPGQLLPISHTRRPRWQRVRLTLQTLAAVLVVAVLIIGSVLLFTSHSYSPGTGSHPKSAVAAQGMVIVLLGDGSIHAYRGGTGESVWSYPTHQDGSAYSGLVVQKQVVYAAVGANIYALHENNGTLIWHKTLPFQPSAGSPNDSQFLVDSGIVYASANSLPQSALYALRSNDGQFLWHITSNQPPLLTASNGVAYVAITIVSSMQTQTILKALHGADEHELWHDITRGTLLSATVTNNVAYVYAFPGAASQGGNKYNKQLLAFNTSDGSLIWSHDVNSGNYSRLDYTQGALLLSTGDQICAHSASDGAQLWCTPNLADAEGLASIAYLVGPDKVYVAYLIRTYTPLSATEIATVCRQNPSCITDSHNMQNVQERLNVEALDVQHGQTQWHFNTLYNGRLTPPLLSLVQLQENMLLASTTSPLVTALNASNGNASWQISSSAHQPAILQMVATK